MWIDHDDLFSPKLHTCKVTEGYSYWVFMYDRILLHFHSVCATFVASWLE